jgi:hypothetical protein
MEQEDTRHALFYYLALAIPFVAFVTLLAMGVTAAISLPIGIIFFALLFSWRRRPVEHLPVLRGVPIVGIALARLSKAQVIAAGLVLAVLLSSVILVFQATRQPLAPIVYAASVMAVIFAVWLFRLVHVIQMEGWRGEKRSEK